MNIKITSKDGITLKTQGKYCTEDIKINVGDEVGGATITTPGGWVGTAVPNTGVVENVYFNTNLSVEEVISLIDAYGTRVVLYSTNHSLGIGFMESVYFIFDEVAGQYYFLSQDVGEGYVGWNPEFNGIIAINEEVFEYEGTENNNQLSSLFSTTPFTQSEGEILTLEGEYDGSTLVLDELPKGGWNGSVVPNTGYVEKVLQAQGHKSIDEFLSKQQNTEIENKAQQQGISLHL